MKYGIITYTSAQNWGGILQAYALKKYLSDIGVDIELINYRAFDSRWFKPRKQLKDIIFSILKYSECKNRIESYECFRKQYMGLDGPVFTTHEELKTLNSVYDAFITGSDQLWNCETEICYDFYLDFVQDSKKKLAYGPSFGQDKIPEQFEQEVTRLLKRYDVKSVRERSGQRIVERLTGEKIQVVCDPTFLLSAEQWDSVRNKHIDESNYIFIYTTQVSGRVVELVKAYKSQHSSVRIITPYALPGIKAEVKKDIGPAEFLSYIKNADYVIGTSFHAVVFSLIFHRDFCVVPHSSTGARVNDLLGSLGLEDHLIGLEFDGVFPFINVDYQCKLDEVIRDSKQYLNSILKKE
ncbi:polysaccharide pyruvyl transferase family protein [Mediterraneibacter glycyrrhizinilyticus]|uniref:polysaccharide pyruvyl transferase family protein n=1 Tax=Mediterraneibacter glycyrrhizinilyticus TaxID=342942 RepID=UPI0025A45F27|nr:polysaccharide pyruvyl transferase family protein [Mediterraneibacter glycyrrhizinilyticus]MDM8125540.1 polysaccharide pyruvyl transferase family protein [Mediterraneibacter glycyrrhizinilyticus]